MNQNLVKGIISECRFEKKYDLDGIPYKDYGFMINKQKYTTRVKEDIYLEDGMNVILQLKPGSNNEVVSGHCIKEDYGWGQKPENLKSQISPSEEYGFLSGSIVEKRKSTTGFIYMDRSFGGTRGSRISYSIVMENGEFHASRDEGEYLKVGMEVAVALKQNVSVLIFNKGTGEYIGLSKPWFIVFLLTIVIFNASMFYLYQTNRTQEWNFGPTLIVANVFLALAALLSYKTFQVTNAAKSYLMSMLGK